MSAWWIQELQNSQMTPPYWWCLLKLRTMRERYIMSPFDMIANFAVKLENISARINDLMGIRRIERDVGYLKNLLSTYLLSYVVRENSDTWEGYTNELWYIIHIYIYIYTCKDTLILKTLRIWLVRHIYRDNDTSRYALSRNQQIPHTHTHTQCSNDNMLYTCIDSPTKANLIRMTKKIMKQYRTNPGVHALMKRFF